MTDVNPQLEQVAGSDTSQPQPRGIDLSFFKDANFLKFVLYFGLWSFAVNVSAPFFNLYMLDNLEINVSLVTIYTGISTGANMLLLLLWGKLADRIGNRPLLVFVGLLVGVTPLLWLGTGADPISLWVWLPLLHVLTGGTWAAIDLCTNNLMMAVAPVGNLSKYFAITGAVAGVSGAIGITIGSFLATLAGGGGLLGLFVLSGVLRLFALLPLLFVQEERSMPLAQLMGVLFPVRQPTELIEAEK
jgi:MFS family permease